MVTENRVYEIARQVLESNPQELTFKKQSDAITRLMVENTNLMKELALLQKFRKERLENQRMNPDEFKTWVYLRAREL